MNVVESVVGKEFFFADKSAAGITQLVAPAANTKGVILQTFSSSSTSLPTFLYVDAAAPASTRDFTKRVILAFAGQFYTMPRSIFVPAGWGVWVANESATTITATWDFFSN
jgi:hypothetical protein